MIRLANEKGILKGNLNRLQEEALQWLMVQEMEDSSNLERERMKYTILAGNINLWQELYGDETEEDEEDIEWITPSSTEEVTQVQDILNILAAQNIGGETNGDT